MRGRFIAAESNPQITQNLRNLWMKKAVDDDKPLPYHPHNTGKEVILKFMSSYHSEVAAA